ncbi:Outer membrane protein TolC [Syntrophus gentianae]|uniref:Outer membrane protein TolC n=1 Tax=Syntrophus gentianae TaxID=43775 RepID=A0A1H7WKZ1_9BACT|nr:TolC family protein [Syntrophus gentianae]SEM22246.1 Outer membrane protein TolC [Syntrophus gentianae]
MIGRKLEFLKILGVALVGLLLAGMACRPVFAGEPQATISLKESIEEALRKSATLHSAKEGVQVAEAQRKEAFTAFLPRFSTSYSYKRLHENPEFNSFIPLLNNRPFTVQSGTKDNYNWAVEVRQPLFSGGGILANYQVYSVGLEAVRQEERTAVLDLVLEVQTAYLNIVKAEKLREVAASSLDRLTAHRDMTRHFYEVGVVPRNDLLYAEVELANGQQALLRAENGVAMAKAKFNTLLRRTMDTPVSVEDILAYAPYNKAFDDCLKTALEKRTEIKTYNFKVEQAQKSVQLARSEYYPAVNLVGNYSRFGDDPGVSGSPYQDSESWYVMAMANWNFWEWGKTKNRVDASLSRERQANDALVNVRDSISLELKNAWLLLKEAEKQIAVSRTAVVQAEENYRINTERYREQVSTATDVIDAQTLLTKANSDHTQALSDYQISLARLKRAMGLEYDQD